MKRNLIIATGVAATGIVLTACGSQGTETVSPWVQDHGRYEIDQQRHQRAETTTPAPVTPSVDDIFIEVLRDNGFTQSRSALIDAGRDGICVLADSGFNFTEIVITTMDRGGLDIDEAGFLIGASVAAYCDHHESMITSASGRGI